MTFELAFELTFEITFELAFVRDSVEFTVSVFVLSRAPGGDRRESGTDAFADKNGPGTPENV